MAVNLRVLPLSSSLLGKGGMGSEGVWGGCCVWRRMLVWVGWGVWLRGERA